MSIHIFKVKKDKHADEREFRIDRPSSASDLGRWQDLIVASDDDELSAKINDLAFKNWCIKWQDAYRRNRSEDPNDWKYGAPVVRGFSKPKVDPDKFDEDQLAYLKSIGVDTTA